MDATLLNLMDATLLADIAGFVADVVLFGLVIWQMRRYDVLVFRLNSTCKNCKHSRKYHHEGWYDIAINGGILRHRGCSYLSMGDRSCGCKDFECILPKNFTWGQY